MSEEAWESTLAPLHQRCVWTWLAWEERNERFPDSVQTKPKGCWRKYKARVVLQQKGKKMPLKQNSPKWHETANRRRGLWEQLFTIRSLLFCECWRCSTTGVRRNLLKACSKNPSGSPGSVLTIAIIRLPGQLIQQIDCSLPKLLAVGLTGLMQVPWEAAATSSVPGAAHNIPWGNERLTSHFCVCRRTQCNAKLSTAFKMSLFLWLLLSFPWLQVSRVLSRALCFKEQAEVLRVFLAWCLQPLAASSVRQGHPGEH